MAFMQRIREFLSSRSSSSDVDSRFFRAILEQRDQGTYEQIFGRPFRNAIATVAPELLAETVPSFNPSWVHAGVYSFEPSAERNYWVYVSAGLSTPWGISGESALPRNPADTPSGIGFELVVRTPQFNDWAINLLSRLMVYQLGVASSLIDGRRISLGERLPLRPLGIESPGSIQAVVTGAPDDLMPSFVLRSGRVDLIQLVGVTAQEYAWSVDHGVQTLFDIMGQQSQWVTHFDRESIEEARGASLSPSLRRYFL
jgi:hypothetical protein